MLYPPELRALRVRDADGRGRGIRTPGPLLPKQVLYQTELTMDEADYSPSARGMLAVSRKPDYLANVLATNGVEHSPRTTHCVLVHAGSLTGCLGTTNGAGALVTEGPTELSSLGIHHDVSPWLVTGFKSSS